MAATLHLEPALLLLRKGDLSSLQVYTAPFVTTIIGREHVRHHPPPQNETT
jgi:hypothetical protein